MDESPPSIHISAAGHMLKSNWPPPTTRSMGSAWNEVRYERARSNFRRRLAPRLAGLFAAMTTIAFLFPLVLGGGVLWFLPGLIVGFAFTVVAFLDDLAPEHLRRRQRGLLGEQETRKVLAKLERDGWTVMHNVDVGRGDLDHLLVGPAGIFAVETKTLLGRVTVEDGTLVTRQEDDPDEVHSWTRLPGRMRSLSATISGWARSDAGVREWVQPVVVVWGDFKERLVKADGIVYVHGRHLGHWLRECPERGTDLLIEPSP